MDEKRRKLRVYRWGNPYARDVKNPEVIVGAYKNKTIFVSEVRKKCDLDDPLMDREDRLYINQSLADVMECDSDDELYMVAIRNPEQILILPCKIFIRGYWKPIIEKVDRGKFIYDDKLKAFEKMEKTIENAERYKKLKGRLIELGKNLKKDKEYMI